MIANKEQFIKDYIRVTKSEEVNEKKLLAHVWLTLTKQNLEHFKIDGVHTLSGHPELFWFKKQENKQEEFTYLYN
ncbi:MAG: DUF5960 family protein [Lactobacillales bacterium]|jgi:mRNA-degrading endonuclease YafQ of YafQ-DinJ toxin-antitoxin module|nr:DUF5960 family protein [Lactobacillales bacterium]